MRVSSVVMLRRSLSKRAAANSPDIATTFSFQCSNGVKIFTKVWGEPSSDRKVLALHGYLDNTGSFDLLGPALAKGGFELVAMDFPGHGRSHAMSKDAWYHLMDYPEYVMEAVRARGWKRFSMIGHSMGGGIASLVAATFPELVERCVFIDILGPLTSSLSSSPKYLRRSIESRRVLVTKEPKPYASFEEAVRQRLKAVSSWGVGQTISWDAATCLVAGGVKQWGADGKVQFTNDTRLRAYSPSYLTDETVMVYLKAIQCPCLVIRGDNGMLTNTAAFRARKAAVGEWLQDLVLPGSHHLHLDEHTAPLVSETVVTFLNGQELRNLELRSAL